MLEADNPRLFTLGVGKSAEMDTILCRTHRERFIIFFCKGMRGYETGTCTIDSKGRHLLLRAMAEGRELGGSSECRARPNGLDRIVWTRKYNNV